MRLHGVATRKRPEVSNPGSRPRVNGIKLIVDCPYECPGHQTTIQTILKEKDNLQLLLLLSRLYLVYEM